MKHDKIYLPRAVYHGGLAADPGRHQGNLWLTPEGVGVGLRHPSKGFVPLAEIAGFQVSGGVEARSRAGAIAAFGVVGLARRSQANTTTVHVLTRRGETAVYVVDRMSPAKASGLVTGWMSVHHISPATPVAAYVSAVDELVKMGDLRARGLISEAEFEAWKHANLR